MAAPYRTIQLQRDIAANWTSANTILAEGELGLELDTRKAKIGDGVTQWNALNYAFSGVGSGSSTTTLQQAYDNSTTPEILTDATRGAFTVKRGSGLDTDTIFEGQNGAGTVTSSIDGNGVINSSSLTASEILITDASKNIVSAPVATYPSLTELTYLKGVTSDIQTQLNSKQSTITFGTGVQTALGVNVGTAGSLVINGGALGTPSSGTLTNCTFPTLNQNTTGTASNVTGTVAIVNGGTGANTLAGASIPTYTSTNTFSTGVKTFLNGMFALRNVANTFSGFFTNTNTADRTYTLKDANGTLAFTSDITGTNSGTNTGDVTLVGTPNYLTIIGQVITRGLIDLASHVTGKLPFANVADVATSTVMYRKTAGSGAMESQTLATLKTDLGLTGTNSGDQTSIVGITGTIAQFNTACTDADFAPIASPSFTGTVTLPTGLTGVIRADAGVVSTDSDVTDLVSAASTTAAGKVELATTAEINTGTDSTRAMPIDQYVASNRNVRYIDIYAIEKATDNAVGTNIIGAIECPFTGTITEIGAYVETAGVTGASVWDVNKNGTTIMTTNKLSIDSAEVSTRTATTAPTLTTTAITAGDLITIDTDSLSTTKPKGLHVRIGIRLT